MNNTIYIKVQTIQERREDSGQHSHLDSLRYFQLILHTLVQSLRFQQTLQIAGRMPDNKDQDTQTENHQQTDNTTDAVQASKELIVRNDNLYMPACCTYLLVEDIIFIPCRRIDIGNDILSFAGTDRGITIGIYLQISRQVFEILQGQIDAHHRNNLAVLVMHRAGTTDHHLLRTRIIQIRLTPPTAVNDQTVLKPLQLSIVMLCTAYIPGKDTVFGKTTAADLIVPTFLREIVRHESDSETRIGTKGANCQTSSRIDSIRIVQTLLSQLRQSLSSRLQFDSTQLYLQLRFAQLSSRQVLRLLTDSMTACKIHDARDSLKRQRRYYNDPNS